MPLWKTVITLVAVLTIPMLAHSATIIVPDDYPTIQGAIEAAVNGDTVLVKPGTYVENIDFLGKAVTVMSSEGPDVTKIDAGDPVNPDLGSAVTFSSGEELDSILDGFTLFNGTGTLDPVNPTYKGKGIYCDGASPTIVNNVITSPFEPYKDVLGGGIYLKDSEAFIALNEITGNMIVSRFGGGIYSIDSSPHIQENLIQSNVAGDEGMRGGGIYCEGGNLSFFNNRIIGNRSDQGGGIYLYFTNGIVADNLIKDNWVSSASIASSGGGVYVNSNGILFSNNMVINNNADFEGGGIVINGSGVVMDGCTFYGNNAGSFGGGIACLNIASLNNSILWNNAPSQIYDPGTLLSVSHCDVEGGCAGPGVINADPAFHDPASCDFHLTYLSPCRDTGDNTAVWVPMDFEGDPRIAYGTVDMGADEFHPHLYWTGDSVPGGSVEGKIVGLPGTDPIGLFFGSGALDPPLPSVFGPWFLQFPVVVVAPLGPVPSSGLVVLPATVPAVQNTFYMQAFIGDVLSNLSVMEVE